MMKILSLKSGHPRRTYSPHFKAEMVAKCLQKTVSLASLAVDNGVNPNVLHRWVTEHKQLGRHAHNTPPVVDAHQATPQTNSAFMPLPFSSASTSCLSTQTIVLDIKRGHTQISVSWPMDRSQACLDFLREWLA